jgi:hypothetical protein
MLSKESGLDLKKANEIMTKKNLKVRFKIIGGLLQLIENFYNKGKD